MCSVAAVVVMIVECYKKVEGEKSQQQYIALTRRAHELDFGLLYYCITEQNFVVFVLLRLKCVWVFFFCKLFASPMFPLYRSVWCVCMYFFGISFCFASCQTNWTKQNSNEEKVYSFTFCHKLKQIFQFVLETWAISKW